MVLGSAEPSTTINVYSDAACSMQLGSGTSAALMSPGIPVTVGQNGTTALYATATAAGGGVSNCSSPLSYTEDEIAPGVPALTGTMPNSPSRSLQPTIVGTADANTLVLLYTTADCSGAALAMANATSAGTFSIKVTVAAATTTQFAALAQDAAGNKSACSGYALSYIHDASAVAPPSFTGTTPPSPSKTSTTPMIQGVAEASVTVKLYTDSGCTSAIAGMTNSDTSGVFSVAVSVGANTTTTFYGLSFDTASSQYSSCSLSGITYTHDNTPPAAPTVTGSAPTSPTNSATPNVTGAAEAGSTVNIYTASDCSGTAVGTGTATGGNYAISVPLGATTTFYATATDAAGNTSACSASGYTIVLDTTAPAAPALSTTSPTSPSTSSTTPIVIGTAESGSTVNIYRTNDCTGPSAGSGLASPGFGISITVPSNSITQLSATATDPAGNVSMCATPITYIHDNIAPNPPTLTSTTPGSPANMNSPVVNGMSEAGAKIQLYTDAGCTATIGSQVTASGTGAFMVTVSVSNDTTYQFYGKATDVAGNVSGCSSGLTYVEDSTPPANPTLNSLPPSNSVTMPTLTGAAESGATVNVYTLANCAGSSMGSTTAAADGTFSIQMTVGMNTSTTFSVKAVDAAMNASGCSNNMTYIHDNIAPGLPTGLASTPGSPAQSSSPSITGSAEANSTVRLFTNPTCSTGVAGTATASGTGAFSIPVSVGAGSTTTFYATATDAANNTSLCSTAFVTYVQDSVAPAVPSGMSTVPGSPGNSLMPSVHGTTEANATVKLYSVAGCGSGLLATGSANGAGAFMINVTVTNGSTTNIYATATDLASNTSACTSTALVYVEDSTPPATPSGLTTSPPSPANNTTPSILGTTEAGASVVAYSNSGCTMVAGSAVATGTGGFTIPVTVATNSTTTFYLVATDAAMNSTTCGAATIAYTDDNSAVATPVLTSTTPVSPSNTSTTPSVNGTTSAGFTIKMYTTSNCTGSFVQVTADASGNFTVPETVTANSTTTFYATATNLALTVSACSSGITYIHDNTAPNPPTGLGVSPTSPANNNNPTISGSAEGNSTVKLYTNNACTSAVVGTGTATGAGSFSITISNGIILDNTTTTFWATATDAAGNASACSSSSVTYVEDSTPPATPSITSTSPAGPSSVTNPTVNGSAEASSTVRLYTMAACAGGVLATGTASAGGTFNIPITVGANTSTSLYAKATDAANNASACSAVFTYVNDSNPPAVPTGLAVNPVGPANNKNPVVSGMTGEAGATIKIYGNATCSGALYGSGTSTGTGGFSVTVTVGNDTTTTFYATATDSANNTSACSASNVTYVDDATPPAQPTGLSANPAGPANNNTPVIHGSAEAGSTVKLYTNATCTSTVAASGPATGGLFSIMIPAGVIADNTTTNFYATATDAANNTSACSTATVQYVEDSQALPPTFSATTSPASPAKSTTPIISGTAEAGSTVSLYTDAACSSAVAGTGTAQGGSFSIQVTVTTDTSTTFYGKITDVANNVSACSASHVTYISDNTAPAFNGVTTVTATGKDTMTIQWAAATDMFTPAASMQYQICMGNAPRACDTTWTTYATATGATSVSLGGLTNGARYWVQVQAVDQAGNTGAPTPNAEASDRTFGPGGTIQIAAGYNFTCALEADGTVWCWGNGGQGQLGNGSNSNSNVPVKVSNLANVVQIAVGGSFTVGDAHACAVKSNGTVWCWGSNAYGQLGNNTSTPSTVPVQVMNVTHGVQVGLGQAHSCVVASDGNIYCWGLGTYGQLGNGLGTSSLIPVTVSNINNAKQVDAGNWSTCALLATGVVKCWGHAGAGELGTGSTVDTTAPGTTAATQVQLAAGELARTLDMGLWHACVIIQNGQMRCWGGNQSGQLGNGATTNALTPVSPLLSGNPITKVRAISAGGDYVNTTTFYGTTCAVQSSGNAYCWGQNGNGQLGNGNNTQQLTAVYANDNFVQGVSVGHQHSCFLKDKGTVQCTGNDSDGRLGNGANVDASTPVAVVNLFSKEGSTQVTGQYNSGCSRMSNGHVYCWGQNNSGQLGNGTTMSTDVGYPLTAVSVGGSALFDILNVSMMYDHACAVRSNGNVVCWGYDANGELGDGGTASENQAVATLAVTDAVQVTTGVNHSCALIVDGTVKCWGYNGYGQLGNGTTTSSGAVVVSGIANAIAIAGQYYSTCALLVDGTAKCWGNNADGQLGNGMTTASSVPVVVTGLVNAMELGAGWFHAIALTSGGFIRSWGYGYYGEMGNSTTTTVNSTFVTASGSTYVHVSGGYYNSCATYLGYVYCWGYNQYGAVGNGATSSTPVSSPAFLGQLQAWTISAGAHTTLQRDDGTADCWGQGQFGQCADGDSSGTARSIVNPQPTIYFP
jgi:alpha-tubulin suppressor-like RCC1 family protein